jgi:hypothetical protein
MGYTGNAHTIAVRKPEGNSPLEDLSIDGRTKLKGILVRYENVDWNLLVQGQLSNYHLVKEDPGLWS